MQNQYQNRTQVRDNNDSISSFQSIINQLSPEQSKFCSVFIENWQLFIAKIHSCEVVGSHHLFGNKFVKYKIKVVTDHVCYHIEKRYRDFLQLYNKVSMFFIPKTQFPTKTHLRSKICPFITEQRKNIFDDFMSQIISLRNSNKSIVSQLLTFLDIKGHYNQQGLDQTIYQTQNIYQYMNNLGMKNNIFGHLLRHQILKMNLVANKSLHYLQKIENLLVNANRNLVKTQDLKVLLVGFHKNPGILEIALSKDNTTVTIILLKSLKKLTNIQQCPYAQILRKILSGVSPHHLILTHSQLLQNQQVKSQYFELIDLYAKIKINVENQQKKQQLLQEILKCQVLEKYNNWKSGKDQRDHQIRRKSKLEYYYIVDQVDQLRESQLSVAASSEAEEMLEEGVEEDFFQKQIDVLMQEESLDREDSHEGYKELWRQQENYCQVSKNKKLLHFSLISDKKLSDVVAVFKKWGHNKMVSSYYPSNKITNINRIFFNFQGKSQKLFQFEQTINQSQTQFEFKMRPPTNLKTSNSFYYYLRISQYDKKLIKINILYYFHHKKVSKLFQNQCTGKTKKMWQNLEDILQARKQISSFGSTATQQATSPF